jgi:phosphopantothenoylcysteine decarboxylase / phosphopantothenate---cysteine ligase
MIEPEEVLAHAGRALEGPGARRAARGGDRRPTREPIDPVRFIGNRSSGRMGYAIAAAAWRRGADVLLVSGPTSLAAPEGVEVRRVETAEEMRARWRTRSPAPTRW